MNPFLFIVGSQRSGTTLLRRMVDTHPLIAIIHETKWIAEWFEKRIGMTPEGYVTPEIIPLLLEHRRFVKLGIGREDLEGLLTSGEPVPYESFITGIFDLYGKAEDKNLVGDKTPRYVRSIPTLHSLWPHAKFVHIIRDGRDVALSTIDWKSGGELRRRFIPLHENPVTTTAVWWNWLVRLGREDGRALGPDLYYEAFYESLVSDPASECRKLCEFLEIPYDDVMLRFHEGNLNIRPGRDPRENAKKAWLPATPGIRNWKSEMPEEDVERFEVAAGGLLRELGYERAFPRPPAGKLDLTSKVRDIFSREVLAGGDRLPEHWSR